MTRYYNENDEFGLDYQQTEFEDNTISEDTDNVIEVSEDVEDFEISEGGEDFDLSEGNDDFDDMDDLDDEGDDLSESFYVPTPQGDRIILEEMAKLGVFGSENEIFQENKRITYLLNKKTMMNRATKKAAYTVAAEADDPLYKQLMAVNQKRNALKEKISRKYNSQARKRVRELQLNKNKTTDLPAVNPNAGSW